MARGKPHAGADIAVGVFGKLPALGDFVSRGLPASFTDPWHQWLVRGLSAMRTSLGDGFDTAYRAMPVWRFVLAAGAAGPVRAAGVMLPSVDSVGREFPLTLAAVGSKLSEASALLEAGIFARFEAEARGAPVDGANVEAWCVRVTALMAPGLCANDGWFWHYFEDGRSAATQSLILDLANAAASVFWTCAPGGIGAGAGLPDFCGLSRPKTEDL